MQTFLKARWENLIMANYAIEPALLQPYLPAGVELDIYNGKAWASLVGFMFKHTKLFGVPIPLMGTFEEVNLRFYVVRKNGGEIKRGVVFINETVPYKIVAWMANKLYKEHYTAIPTKNKITYSDATKNILYQWKINNRWNSLAVTAAAANKEMQTGSFEEFIFEHYYGYTKINSQTTEEYKVNHPRWHTNEVLNYTIDCDFNKMYGPEFAYLSDVEPDSVFVAGGSVVSVDWKRQKLMTL
jgi:hypothetical protein